MCKCRLEESNTGGKKLNIFIIITEGESKDDSNHLIFA